MVNDTVSNDLRWKCYANWQQCRKHRQNLKIILSKIIVFVTRSSTNDCFTAGRLADWRILDYIWAGVQIVYCSERKYNSQECDLYRLYHDALSAHLRPPFCSLGRRGYFGPNRWRSCWSFIHRPRQMKRKKIKKGGDESCRGELIFDGGSKRRRLGKLGALSWLHWSLEALAKFVFPNLGCAYVRMSFHPRPWSHAQLYKSAELLLLPSTEVERAGFFIQRTWFKMHSSKLLGQVDEALDIIQQWGSQLGNDKGVRRLRTVIP